MTQAQPALRTLHVPGAQIRQHIGKIYVKTSDTSAFDILNDQFCSSSQKMALYPFTPIHARSASDCNDPVLFEILTNNNYSLIALIPNPTEGIPLFLAKEGTGSGFLPLDAINFAYEVDLRTREAFIAFSDYRPELFVSQIDSLLTDVLGGPGLLASQKPLPGTISFTGREKRLSKKEKEEQLQSARAGFVENVKEERRCKTPEVSRAIDMVINNLPNSTKLLIIRKYIDSLSEEELQQLYDESIDMNKLAEKSQVKIIVRERLKERDDPSKYEDLTVTKGDYRICYKFEGENKDHLFDFITRAECAVYLCCLMARYEYGDMDIDFADMEEMFIGAFRFIYGESYIEAKRTYDMLLDEVDTNGGLLHQGTLKDYISNIKKTIDRELLHKENPCIFYFRKNSHLGILPRNIVLPPGIMDAVFSLGKKSLSGRV